MAKGAKSPLDTYAGIGSWTSDASLPSRVVVGVTREELAAELRRYGNALPDEYECVPVPQRVVLGAADTLTDDAVYVIAFDQDVFGIFRTREEAEADKERQIAEGGPAWEDCKVERWLLGGR